MNKIEQRFERFVNQVGKMVLQLLSSLNIKKFHKEGRDTIDRVIVMLFFLYPFDLESHISAHSSYSLILIHKVQHFDKGASLRHQSNIKQDSILRLQFFAKSIKEPVMRRELSSVFIFCHHKKIHGWLVLFFIIFLPPRRAFSGNLETKRMD